MPRFHSKQGPGEYLRKRRKAFQYAGRGVSRLVGGEAHARIHLVAAVAVVAAGIVFGLTPGEWCLVALCIGGVFMAEAFNTAIEKIADRVTMEKDPLIGAAKDIAAGGVLVMAIAAAAVGLIIFLPKIF